jgi:hypothetical protein
MTAAVAARESIPAEELNIQVALLFKGGFMPQFDEHIPP